jgi:hypothetical protein
LLCVTHNWRPNNKGCSVEEYASGDREQIMSGTCLVLRTFDCSLMPCESCTKITSSTSANLRRHSSATFAYTSRYHSTSAMSLISHAVYRCKVVKFYNKLVETKRAERSRNMCKEKAIKETLQRNITKRCNCKGESLTFTRQNTCPSRGAKRAVRKENGVLIGSAVGYNGKVSICTRLI